jgi:hypothetical protein
VATRSTPRSVAENDTIATSVATTVMAATTAKAARSLILIPNRA